MDIRRLFQHLLASHWRVRRAFPPATVATIGAAIQAAEQGHDGEIRIAVEGALDPWSLIRGQTPRERAIEVFANLHVWDTQHNNGVLIYVLLADRAVEIVADRGIHAHEASATWATICRQIETACGRGDYEAGAKAGIEAVAHALRRHFPHPDGQGNELPDAPVLL